MPVPDPATTEWVPIWGVGLANSLPTVIESAAVGTVNDWAPAGLVSGKSTVILWSGASNLVISGVLAGVSGQLLTIRNTAASAIISLTHFFQSSSAIPNRLFNIAGSSATPIAPGGMAQYIYSPLGYWLLLDHIQGSWITAPFVAGNFYGYSTMTWTVIAGNVISIGYHLVGKQMSFSCRIAGTTLGGTATNAIYINKAQWGGFSVPTLSNSLAGLFNNNNIQRSDIRVQVLTDDISILTLAGGAMVLGPNCLLFHTMFFEVT